MDKKFFVFDMDGTLLNNKNIIHNKTINALKKAKVNGHIIAIATGRPLFYIKKIKGTEIFDYLICNNGAYYLNQKTGKRKIGHFVSEHVIDKMIEMARENKAIVLINDVDTTVASIFSEKLDISNKEIKVQWGEIKIVDIKDIFNHVNKKLVTQSTIFSNPKQIKKMQNELSKIGRNIEIRIADRKYLDANPKNISKYFTISEIAKEINIINKNIITFGDSGNDLEMIIESGYGIAMGNATSELKEIADEIIGDNNSTTIATKIEEIIKE